MDAAAHRPAPATSYFGEHFTLDGYGGEPSKLADRALVHHCLADLCERIGMRPLAPPLVAQALDNQAKDPGGWSGVLLIVESHITLHTFPRRRFLSADVYSCKTGMDLRAIETVLASAFDLQETETHFLRRGLRYPAWNLL